MQGPWLATSKPLFDQLQNPEYQSWVLEHEDSNRTSSTDIGPKTENILFLKS